MDFNKSKGYVSTLNLIQIDLEVYKKITSRDSTFSYSSILNEGQVHSAHSLEVHVTISNSKEINL